MPFFLADIKPFDWHRLLFSDDAPPLFLAEVVLRCVVTYVLTIAALRVSGRRGVRQLSIFELSILLALGSASGDAMLYHDTPLTHIAVVFAVVMGLYALFNRLTERFPKFSDWLEGRPVQLIADGAIIDQALRQQKLTQKELFGQLRQLQVEHLGQVRCAYIEASGNVSAFFFPDDEVKPGLPIFPEIVRQPLTRIATAGPHACTECGQVLDLKPTAAQACPVCRCDHWLPACTSKRVA